MTLHLSDTARRFKAHLAIIFLVIWWLNPFPITAAADPNSRPLWELGLTAGGGWVPDYPAADEYHAAGLALPYAVYRGSFFRAGDDGIARGRFFRSSRFEFDIGLSGSFPADSDQNDARRGMPDLDFLLEAGPRLKFRFANLTATSHLSLRLAVRPVMSISLSQVGYRGLVFSPRLVYTQTRLFNTKTRFVARLGPVFATNRFMDYFYEVEPRFATPNRAAFSAKGGYLGSKLTLSARLPLTNRVRILGAVQVGYYAGATNEESPLFRDQVNVGAGLAMTWAIFQSKRQAAD